MGASLCSSCGQLRAPRGDQECSVCWLVAELKREHVAGEHSERLNPSCIRCTSDNFSDEGFVLTEELREKLGMTVRYCSDCEVRLTPKNRASSIGAIGFEDTCIVCYEYAGWVNSHVDNSHDFDNADLECPVCNEAKNEQDKPRKKKTKAGSESHISHQDCYDQGLHEKTAKGRAVCRAGKFKNQDKK